MNPQTVRISPNIGVVAFVSLLACGCGSSPIVPARLESALANTFSNLAQVQVALMGLTPMTPSDFAVQPSCRKLLGTHNRGSGDWMCTVSGVDPIAGR